MAHESWKRESDETGCQAPEGPSLCANNCGFFGSAATMNFCSKCYRELLMKQAKASSSAAVVEKSSAAAMEFEQSLEKQDQPVRQSICADAERSSSGESEKRLANRCNWCRKRVGLTGFKCRCGDTFCSLHRYCDKHNCPFDYQKAGREAIARANPVVKAEKIEKI